MCLYTIEQQKMDLQGFGFKGFSIFKKKRENLFVISNNSKQRVYLYNRWYTDHNKGTIGNLAYRPGFHICLNYKDALRLDFDELWLVEYKCGHTLGLNSAADSRMTVVAKKMKLVKRLH